MLIFAVFSVLGLYFAFKPPHYRDYIFESQTLDGRSLTMRYPEGWELHQGKKGIVSLKRRRVSFLQSLIEQVVFKITPADEANCQMEISVATLEGWNKVENWKSRRSIKMFSVPGEKFGVETSEFSNSMGEGYSETFTTPLRNPFSQKYAYLTSRFLLMKNRNNEGAIILKASYFSPYSLKTRMDTLSKDILDHVKVSSSEE